ncbi:MAG: PEP-CTERM sorting domain-containing protein [Chthonomonas sp.]|nr:PEP-CTERM sorting domain-containing protein [Chthonomonas sp.]
MRAITLGFTMIATIGSASATLFLVNSPATYLRAFGEAPFAANAINLNANGFFAGQTVLLKRAGSWNHLGGPTPTDYGLSCVFSSSSALLGPNNLNRIPGAIDAGPDWVSPNTQIGGFSTDIAEDFQVDNNTGTANGIVLTIPAGAQYIFCTAQDNFFSDNNNTTEFYLSIQPVPEPGTLAALAVGAGLLLRRRLKR